MPTNTVNMEADLQGSADAKLAKVQGALDRLNKAGQNTTTTFDAAGQALLEFERRLDDVNAAHEESNQKLKDVLNKYSEFGAEVGQQKQILNDIVVASAKTGVAIAKVARHAEELVIEFQDAERATENLNLAMEYTARTGQRVEESVAAYVETVSGRGTAAFQQFGQRGRDIAEVLEKIEDREERARVAQQLLTKEMRRAQSVTGKLADKYNVLKARAISAAGGLKQIQLVGGGLIAVVGALSAGLSAAALKGVAVFTEQNVRSAAALKRKQRAVDDLFYAIGGAILGWQQGSRNIDRFTGALKDATKWVNKNQDQIQKWVKLILKGSGWVARGAAEIIGGLAMLATGIYEAVRGAFSNIVVGAANAIELLIDELNKIGVVSNETAVAVSDIRAQLEQTFNTEFDFSVTEDIAAFVEGIRDGHEEFNVLVDDLEKGSKKLSGPRRRPGQGPPKPKSAKDVGLSGGFEEIEIGVKIDEGRTKVAAQWLIDSMGELGDRLQVAARYQEVMEWKTVDATKALKKQAKALERLKRIGEKQDELVARITGGFQDMAYGALEAAGAMMAGAMASEEFGQNLLDMFASLIQSVVPILNELAISFIAVNTGNAVLLFAAAGALAVLAGTLGGFGSTSSSGSSRRASADGIRQDLADRAQEREQTLQITVNVGNERLARQTIEATRGAMLRNVLPGGGSVRLARG